MKKNTLIVVAIVILAMFVMNSDQWYKMMGVDPAKAKAARDAKLKESVQVDSTTTDSVAAPVDTTKTDSLTIDTLNIDGDSVNANGDSVAVVDTTPVAPVIEYQKITISNEVLSLVISEKGGVVRSAKPLEFTYAKNHPKKGEIVELVDDFGTGIAGIDIGDESTLESYYKYNSELSDSSKAVFEAMVNGSKVTKIYTLSPKSYYVDYNVSSELLKGKELTFSLGSPINEPEDSLNRSSRYSLREASVSDSKKVTIIKAGEKKKKKTDFSADLRWMSLSSKYFGIAAILPSSVPAEVKVKNYYVDKRAEKKEKAENKKVTGTFNFDSDETALSMKLFFGPTKVKVLKEADVKLEGIVYRGWGWFLGAHIWFPWICKLVNGMMGFFYNTIAFKDYGLAILLLTIILRLITFPLTQSSMKSMKAMKEIQPKIQAIQEKYKNNPELQRAKMMEFYKDEGVNPLAGVGGCLPMFLQMPIMISLFVVLRRSVELRGETTFMVPWLQDLSQAEVLFRLPFEIPFYGSNFALLPLLYAGLMFFSNKMTMKDPAQASMVYIMPVVMLVMFNNFPSGLTMYFVFSNILQLVQQHFVNKGDKAAVAKA